MSLNHQSVRRDKIAVAAFILVGLAGVIVYILLYGSAFPSASLDLKITRADAVRIGERSLRAQGFDLSGYQHVVTFRYDRRGKEYLERNLGLRKANQLMGRRVKTWYWRARWFKPLQEEEFSAYISPTGEFIGFRHKIPEKQRGKDLSRAAALQQASEFLRSVGLDPSKYRLMSDSSEKRPNRTDHYFNWEERDFKAADATNRVRVSVAGDKVSYFNRYLKVPEKWERKVEEEFGKGSFFVTIAGVFSAGFGLALFITFLFAVRARAIRWRFTLILAGALVVVYITQSLNSLPILKSFYMTTESMGSFIGGHIVSIIGGAIGIAVSIFLLGSAGDAMHRWALPERIPLSRMLTRRGLISREFVQANLVGFGLGLAQLGYVSAFYVVAMKYFHIWSPAEVPYDNTLSTALPWIYPLTIGLSAALTEELFFRLFAVSFLKRYVRLTWLAVVVPAVVWAFLHSNYPQQPAYIRGIEISVYGIILGWVFLKYGVVATVVSHYTYNAVVSGTLLVRSENPYFRASGLAVMLLMLLPLLPAAIRMLRKPGPELDEQVLHEEPAPVRPAAPPVRQAEEPGPPRTYEPFPRRKLGLIALAGLAALIASYLCFPQEFLPDRYDVINRRKAAQLAEQHIRALGVKTKGYMSYSQYGGDSTGLGATYIVRQIGREKADELFERELHDAGWYTRWFKPQKKESYEIWLDPDGKFYSWNHAIEEDAPGPNLPSAEARALAEAWLTRAGVELSQYKLVDSSTDKREKRTDHWLTWEKKKPRVKESTFRLSIGVQGNEVLSRSDFIKIPDEYRRNEYKRTTRMTIFTGIFGLLMTALAIAAFVVFVIQFAARRINWKLALGWAAALTALGIVGWVDGLPTFYAGYWDTDPLSRFIALGIITTVLAFAVGLVGTACLVGFADAVYRQAFPDKPSLTQWFARKDGKWRLRAFQEGAVVAYASLLLGAAAAPAANFISDRFFRAVAVVQGGWSGATDGLSPIIAVLPGSLSAAVYLTVLVALAVSLAKLYLKRKWLILALLIGFPLLGIAGDAKNWLSFWEQVLWMAVGIPVAYLALTRWFGHNAYAYAIAMASGYLLSSGLGLVQASDPALKINGWVLIVLGLLPAVAALYIRLRHGYGERSGRDTENAAMVPQDGSGFSEVAPE